MLLPRWCYFNIYAMSSWTRTIVVPLSIFYAHQAGAPAAAGAGHRASCSCEPPETPLWPHPPTRRWLTLDQLLPRRRSGCSSGSRRWGLGPIRRLAVRRADDWMLRALRRQRRPRRHLPADDLHGHLPALPGLRRRFAGDAVGAEAARRPDDRGGRHDPPAAVLLAGVGHGPDAQRPGRRRAAGRRTRPLRRGGALAARTRSAAARRLEHRQSGPGAGRLVLRVPQRLLSRHRRHGDGADGAGQDGPRRHAAGPAGGRARRCAGCWACRTATAAGRPSIATSTARC